MPPSKGLREREREGPAPWPVRQRARRWATLACLSFALSFALPFALFGIAHAEPSVFFGLGALDDSGSHAYAVSADGETVVGDSYVVVGSGNEAFRWTQESGMVGLGWLTGQLGPSSTARGVSADGALVVGRTEDSPTTLGNQACFWAASSGFVLEELVPPPHLDASAYGVSDDGLIIVGANDDGPFRQFGGSGMIQLGLLPGGYVGGTAWGTSADGSVIVGWAKNASGVGEAFRWTEVNGMEALDDVPPGPGGSDALDVSADGTTVVGNFSIGGGAFRWTESTGMVNLGLLPGDFIYSRARGVSGDGSVVVGISHKSNEVLDERAFVWDAEHGMRDLRSVLLSLGLDIRAWTLLRAESVSDDGRVIVGWALGPNGDEAFYARLDESVGPAVPGAENMPGLEPMGLLVLAGLLGSIGYRTGLRRSPLIPRSPHPSMKTASW